MRLLLDTHVALWAIADDRRLPAQARVLISDPENEVLVSVASVWEIAIKHALGGGRSGGMPISGSAALGYFRAAGYAVLEIAAAHVLAVEHLPALHADPFDRLLAAQAASVPLRLITHDPVVGRYSDQIIVV